MTSVLVSSLLLSLIMDKTISMSIAQRTASSEITVQHQNFHWIYDSELHKFSLATPKIRSTRRPVNERFTVVDGLCYPE